MVIWFFESTLFFDWLIKSEYRNIKGARPPRALFSAPSRKTPRAPKNFQAFVTSSTRKWLAARAQPATSGAGVLPVYFGIRVQGFNAEIKIRRGLSPKEKNRISGNPAQYQVTAMLSFKPTVCHSSAPMGAGRNPVEISNG